MRKNYFTRNYIHGQLSLVLVIFISLGFVGMNGLNAQCTADAGTLTTNVSPVQLAGGTVTISATENAAPTVPGDYEIGYVLTSGPTLIVQNASLTPSFEVTTPGDYTIHAMVAEINDPLDPNFLDLSGVIPGTTTGGDILNLIAVSGVCASLDVAGAPIVVEACTAAAGTLTADATPVQLAGGTITISATAGTAPTVPTNYEVAYVLTSGPTLIIEATNSSPSFDITSAGDYTIHTLVAELSDSMDPNYLDLSVVVPGTTTGGDVLGIVTSNGLCAALDVAGAPITVDAALSIEDNIINAFSVYPNPVVNIVNLNNSENLSIQSVRFYDISGRTVKALNFSNARSKRMAFDISEFANGLYFIEVNTDKGQFKKRLLKK